METLGEALRWAIRELRRSETETPRLDAEVLLYEAAGVDRATLLAHPESHLTSDQSTRFRERVGCRQQCEPVAYIVGHKEFYGLDFLVDRRVLVPRPETEQLVEEALAWSRRRSPSGAGLAIADVGTGSGVVAVTLAVQLSEAALYAIDASQGALEVAAANARRHGVDLRIHLLYGSLLDPMPAPADLIVANLPYVSDDEWKDLPADIRQYEPAEAIRGGRDGLILIRALLAQAQGKLRPGGAVMLEIGAEQGDAMRELARSAFPAARVTVLEDLSGLDRDVIIETGQ